MEPSIRGALPGTPTVDRLLDSAAALFWQKGYAATTTREIAAALHIQQASLYYHMASKEDLLYHVCVASLQQFLADVPAAVDGVSSPLDQIRILIRTHVATLLSHQARNVAMLSELSALSRRHRMEVVKQREEYREFVRLALENAQAAGAIRADIPATYLCLALLNILNWPVRWFRGDQALSADELAELLITIYLHGAALPGRRRSLGVPDLEPQTKKPASRGRKLPNAPENSTVERLLDAAVSLFSHKGYAATSTREVAALLGMQKASLYYHIEGKEDLLYFICKASLERIRSDVEAAVQDVRDPLERTRVMICAHVESMLRDADEHATTLVEMRALSPQRRARVLSLRDAYEELVRSILGEAQSAGVLRDDIPVKYLCLILLGLMNRVLVWHRRKGPLSPGQLGQLLAVIFLTGTAAAGD